MSGPIRRPTPDRIVSVVLKASCAVDSSRQSVWGAIGELQRAAERLGWDVEVVLERDSVGVADWRVPVAEAVVP